MKDLFTRQICCGFIYCGTFMLVDKNVSLLHVLDRSRPFAIYPAPAICLRITYAKPEEDGKGSHGELVGQMEDDCSMEYGLYRVTRHRMNSSS